MRSKTKLTEKQLKKRRIARNGWILGLSVFFGIIVLCYLLSLL